MQACLYLISAFTKKWCLSECHHTCLDHIHAHIFTDSIYLLPHKVRRGMVYVLDA